MFFSNFQIATIYLSFVIAFWIALFWRYKDNLVDSSNNRESFAVLMSVFFWSAFLAFGLHLLMNLLHNFKVDFINSEYFFVFSLLLEELVKATALIVWLEIAWKKFNEISDWVIYWVFAVLGFIFYENIIYIISLMNPDFNMQYLIYSFQRWYFSFGAHMSIMIFSFFYAVSYLKSSKLPVWMRPKPYYIFQHIKLMWDWSYYWGLAYFALSPIVLLINLISSRKEKLSIVLYWSFFLSFIVHVVYDWLLDYGWVYAFLALVTTWFTSFILYKRFEKLDV